MKIKCLLFSLVSLFCLSACSGLRDVDDLIKGNVTIKISCDEHCSVIGDSMVTVKKDSSIYFLLSFDESYVFAGSTNGKYENGLLTISKCSFSQTIYVYSYLEGDVLVSVVNDKALGTVELTPNRNSYAVGDEITITCTPKTQRLFTCWTLDNYYHVAYGKVSGTPFSFSSTYTFVVTKNITICANYLMAVNKSWVINYDCNGGKTIDGNNDFVLDTANQFGYKNPITTTGSWFMERDGYTLSSFNTNLDGTGVRIGIGSKAQQSFFDNENKLTLYAQWEKWTDSDNFEYTEENDEIYIDKYSGSDSIVCIPNFIKEKPVTKIKENSFNDCVDLEKIIFNENLSVIENMAFNNCRNLMIIELYSSLKKAFNTSFNECDNLKTCYINSNCHAMTIDVAWMDLSKQVEYINSIETDLPLMIFCCVSTGQVNNRIDLANKIRAKYRPYIFAASGSTDMNLMYNILLNYITINDKVVFVSHRNQLGPIKNLRNLGYIDNNFDMISKIDFSSIKTQILESFENYSTVVTRDPKVSYYNLEMGSSLNEFNYSTTEEIRPPLENKSSTKYDMTKFVADFDNYLGNIRKTTETHNFPKENVIITSRPWNINNIDNLKSFEILDDKYRDYFEGFTFIDRLQDNIYPGDYFNLNDDMHLNPFGGYERLKRWDLALSKI